MKQRTDIDKQLLWDVESVYTTPQDFEQDFARVDDLLRPIAAMRGQLNSPEALAQCFRLNDDLSLLMERLHLYAHMMEDVDTTVGENQARMSRMRSTYARVGGETAWIEPEILAHPAETLDAWTAAPALAEHRRSMERMVRRKPHTLSAAEETLLSKAGEVLGNSYEAFNKLMNADLKFRPAKDAAGAEHEVTNGTFYSLLQSKDRVLRRSAWESIYTGVGDHENLLATLLAGNCKADVYTSGVRHHAGALEASLFPDAIPVEVYESLIAAVNEALPIFHQYIDLRARQLGVEDLDMWDLYVPIVPDFELNVEWDECRQWIIDSTRPLGEDYAVGVGQSFTDRWYDVYENKGKRSGAYSSGCYGQKPFMLLNYHGTLNDVFTVAHELGHSMHSYLSQRHQPYRYSHYPIFLAEIASTTNEALLHHHLMETRQDPKLRAYLLNHLCDSFRGTMFRQTMFAEFELEIHRRLEKGGALTAESLKEYYYALNAKYYGPRIKADPRIAMEWARIPHFYYNFYVYKYATGFAAAQIFAGQILSGEAGRDQYLGFLKSGKSLDPLETVQRAGVDLADPAVLQRAFAAFRDAIAELSVLLA